MTYEHYGDRLRVIVGDLSMGEEPSNQFGVTLHVGDDMHEFADYGICWPKVWNDVTYYVSHSLVVSFWHWGLYLSMRGRSVK